MLIFIIQPYCLSKIMVYPYKMYMQGLWTPAEVFLGLAAEGYNLEYKRVPMSRERTPQTQDLDQLHAHVGLPSKKTNKNTYYVFLSRTSTGSSARFSATFASTCLTAPTALSHQSNGESLTQPSSLVRNDSETFDLSRSIEAGEYRGIMNLLRALPRGGDAKKAVDDAIERCQSIGSITQDILECKKISEEESIDQVDPADASFAKRLGLHYLQRYFYLIAFRAFLESGSEENFSDWVGDRKEISYLASVLTLE